LFLRAKATKRYRDLCIVALEAGPRVKAAPVRNVPKHYAGRGPSGPRLEMSGLQGLIMLQEMAERSWRVQRPSDRSPQAQPFAAFIAHRARLTYESDAGREIPPTCIRFPQCGARGSCQTRGRRSGRAHHHQPDRLLLPRHRMIAREIGSRALIVAMPPMLSYQCVRVLGWIVGDVINTRDEVRGLMQ
jgi:hypothetical protein